MRTFALLTLLCACGASPGGHITVNFPADLVGDGFLHVAVYDSGSCSGVNLPFNLDEAIARSTDPAVFDGEGKHPISLSAVPAGEDRLLVAVVEQDGEQVCFGCAEGLLIADGETSQATITLSGCP